MALTLVSSRWGELDILPKRKDDHWLVWCASGALRVIQSNEYEAWLSEHYNEAYTIVFAHKASAHITPRHPLWETLVDLTATHWVKILPQGEAQYQTWRGQVTDPVDLVGIEIRLKPTSLPATSAG